MARANNGGWDFIKVGNCYQYKEDFWIAMVTILEDNSTDEAYQFKVRVDRSNVKVGDADTFEVYNVKDSSGYYSGMPQFYEQQEYQCEYTYINEKAKNHV